VLKIHDGVSRTKVLGIYDGVAHQKNDVCSGGQFFDYGLNLREVSYNLMRLMQELFLGK
jgi:hypothetical protein